MTDFRALCVELVDDLELCDWPYKLKETIRADIDRARAALAEEPAVPQPQPPAEGEVGDRVAWLRRFAAVDWIADETADKLYAIADILSQHQPAPPAEGEVAKLAAKLRRLAPHNPLGTADPTITRAADLLEQRHPAPVEGEVAELVRLLGSMAAEAELADQVHDASVLDRAADLLQRLAAPVLEPALARINDILNDSGRIFQTDVLEALELARQALEQRKTAPAPVPVAERLPGPEDCDAEGRCWLFSKVEKEWRLIDAGNPGVPHLKYCFSHWLPAHALPIPHQQEDHQ